MLRKLEQMLADADREFNDAARMHSSGKCSYWSGYRAAIAAVIKLIK